MPTCITPTTSTSPPSLPTTLHRRYLSYLLLSYLSPLINIPLPSFLPSFLPSTSQLPKFNNTYELTAIPSHSLLLSHSSSLTHFFFHLIYFISMEVDQPNTLTSSMTYDEVSMERSKGFVKALQELKNLRPQLYSAAEYCEKSYLHSEQKQMVLDNLKDYVVRALVNAVDHLGTVAYKLTDLLEQQTSDVSNTELKITCLNQRLLTCQTYIDKEGLRQQQLLAIIPRYHKRYILPNSVNKKVHFSPAVQADPRQIHVQARPRVHPSDSPGTLSWHLDSETNFPVKGTPKTAYSSSEVLKSSLRSSPVFHLFDNEDSIRGKSSGAHTQLSSANSAAASLQLSHRDSMPNSKPMTPYRSFDNTRQPIVKAPVRHKSMLSAFFVKHKTPKLRPGTVP